MFWRPRETEFWDNETLSAETNQFSVTHPRLSGIEESQVYESFGAPDEVASGSQEIKDGQTVFEADRDLRYCSLLPHVTVCFSMFAERVHHLYFVPKVRWCSRKLRKAFGKQYAPQ